MSKLYSLNLLRFGAEIFGLDLKKSLSNDIISQIKKDVTKYRLVIFRNLGQVSGDRHVEIAEWFGKIDNVTFTKHPMSPNVNVFRVSNDPQQGCIGVGTTGWHIDGTFRKCPYSYSLYHMYEVPHTGGDTMFFPFTELIEHLPENTRLKLEKLWMLSDRRGKLIHPLIYPHPKTGRPTMCMHLGMINAFVSNYQSLDPNNEAQLLSVEETQDILTEIQSCIDKYAHIYSHNWQKSGDLIISDNLAVAHQAGPISKSVAESGLRVLHRVTVLGTEIPKKQYSFYPDKDNCAY